MIYCVDEYNERGGGDSDPQCGVPDWVACGATRSLTPPTAVREAGAIPARAHSTEIRQLRPRRRDRVRCTYGEGVFAE